MSMPLFTGTGPRPVSASAGEIRFNTTIHRMEMFDGAKWNVISHPDTVRHLIFDVGTVFGHNYQTVWPVGYNWKELTDWMVETFGSTAEDGVWTANMRWYVNNEKIWFRDTKDRDWFVLRWNS